VDLLLTKAGNFTMKATIILFKKSLDLAIAIGHLGVKIS
jgi:hypothetical protein